MRSLRYIPRYTVADYLLWEGAWELIDGLPTSMSPSSVRLHQQVAGKIFSHIRVAIDTLTDSCGKCDVVYELDWIVDDTTVLRPDIAVICEEDADFIIHPPVLIVEILSPSTALKDRQVKYSIYQEKGVNYYLIVDPVTHHCRAFHLTLQGYVEYTDTTFILHDRCTFSMDIPMLLLS